MSPFKLIGVVLAIGIFATIVMDIGGAIMRWTGITAGAPPELIGKWIYSAFRGEVFVDDIRTSPGGLVPLPRFLVYHYLIGILLAGIFYLLVVLFNLHPIHWWMPVVFGLTTTLIPALLMFPGMGFGLFGSSGPPEYLLLRTAIINHLFYGLGLALAARFFLR